MRFAGDECSFVLFGFVSAFGELPQFIGSSFLKIYLASLRSFLRTVRRAGSLCLS